MSEHIWRIYRYYNPIEDKSYVGQTTRNVNDRAKNGKGYKKGTSFRDAIDKYGWNTFEQSILRLCTNQEDASYWEKYFIEKFNCIDNGYNSSCGGETSGTLDAHLSESCKKHLSESHKGHEVTEETRKKISENHSGEKNPMYGKRGELNPNYGKKHPGLNVGNNNPAYGRTWYNNGTINIYININTTEVPDGFKKGMLRRSK